MAGLLAVGGGRERAEGVVAGFRAGHEGSARPTESHDVAQVVCIGVVEDARGRAHFGLHGDDLSR